MNGGRRVSSKRGSGKQVLRAWLLRLRGLLTRDRNEREFAEEIETHLQMHIEDNLRSGMTAEEARRAALLKLGGMEVTKQAYRERNTLPLIENLGQDLRYAARQLRRNPGFTVTAVIVLALGMAASLAIFAFVDAALLKPLPYQSPKRLVSVYETTAMCPRCNVAYLNFRDWKKSTAALFQSLDAWGYNTYLVGTPTGTEMADGTRVTDGFFRTLGVAPVLGRDFYLGEDAPGKPRTVLLSYTAWQNRFGGRAGAVGKSITLNDDAYTIVGVLPKDFQFALRGASEFWVPLGAPSSCEERRGCHSLFGLARLKDGVSIASALAGMKAIAQQMARQYPNSNRDFSADVVALSDVVAGDGRPILLMLLSGAGLLLLIACVNVSSLLLVRSESRRREMAVRGALGASGARLVRQFVTEGVLLVALGSVAGVATAFAVMRLLLRLIPAPMMEGMPYLQQLGLSYRVMAVAALIGLLATVIFSLAPALRLRRADLQADLNEGARGSAGTLWRRLGSKLVVVELATAVVLLVGAGLLGKSLYRLLHVDIGMQPERVAKLEIRMPGAYGDDPQVAALERKLIASVRALPGVRSVGISTALPLRNWGMDANIVVPGRRENGERNEVPERNVSADYLRTLGAKMLRGRYFTGAEDDPKKAPVAVINQTFAKKYFPGEDPIGKRIKYENAHDSMEIIGVISDMKEGQLDTENRASIYVPFTQGWFRSFSLVVRTSQDEKSILSTLTVAIHRIDPGIGTSDAAAMSDVMNDSQAAYMHRSAAWLVGGFAGLALMLGVVGLYGVIAYSVSQRSREIGVRMALGAQRSSVYRLILREAGWLAAMGIAAGLLCSIAAATFMRNLLFGVAAWDVPTLAAVAGVLAICAVLASYIPARRAASINPVEALRAE
jgi:predicted permease